MDEAAVYCPDCDKTFEIRWEAGNPKWMQRAMTKANEAHREVSPECKGANFEIKRAASFLAEPER